MLCWQQRSGLNPQMFAPYSQELLAPHGRPHHVDVQTQSVDQLVAVHEGLGEQEAVLRKRTRQLPRYFAPEMQEHAAARAEGRHANNSPRSANRSTAHARRSRGLAVLPAARSLRETRSRSALSLADLHLEPGRLAEIGLLARDEAGGQLGQRSDHPLGIDAPEERVGGLVLGAIALS